MKTRPRSIVSVFVVFPCLAVIFVLQSCSFLKGLSVSTSSDVFVWQLAALNSPGTVGVTKSGNPLTIDSPQGKAVQFDGKGEALLVDSNPLINLNQFTVEVLFRPDPKGLPEQRFLHVGELDGDRMMVETRLTADNHWYLDAYIKSGDSSKALIDKSLLHSTGEWHHIAFVVDKGKMDTFVDGKHELEGHVTFSPFKKGQSSIGVRMNKQYWFKGAIATIRVTPRCLKPEEFTGN